MSKIFERFIQGIRRGLKKRGFSKEKISSHIDKVIERYEHSPIFNDEVIEDDFDMEQEFCDGITELSVEQECPIPLVMLKQTREEIIDRRINQLSVHYDNLQKELGEEWFPELDENDPDYVSPLDETDIFGRTPIIEAAINGNVEYVKELIKAGADLSITDNSGNSAQRAAILNGYDNIARIINKAKKSRKKG